jgi:hypothetical protein
MIGIIHDDGDWLSPGACPTLKAFYTAASIRSNTPTSLAIVESANPCAVHDAHERVQQGSRPPSQSPDHTSVDETPNV